MSENERIVGALREMKFFEGIAPDHLQRLAAIARVVEFPARHDIFREDDPAREVYLITRGHVSLVICAPGVGCRQLMDVSDGELIGWSPLVGHSRLSDTARTLTPTSAIAMQGAQILELCTQYPEFGYDFMHRTAEALAARLIATRLQLLKMSGFDLPEVQIESD
jgi:CRP-like cAMP-binding protein